MIILEASRGVSFVNPFLPDFDLDPWR